MATRDYISALFALLPRGYIWSRDADGTLAKLVSGLAKELQRIDDRAEELLAESRPGAVSKLLEEWEAELGLPDICEPSTDTEVRRQAVQQKAALYGSQSRGFILGLCDDAGIRGYINEFQESTFGGEFGGRYRGRDWIFVIELHTESVNVSSETHARTERLIRRYMHAHKILTASRSQTSYLAAGGAVITYNGQPLATTVNTPLNTISDDCKD